MKEGFDLGIYPVMQNILFPFGNDVDIFVFQISIFVLDFFDWCVL